MERFDLYVDQMLRARRGERFNAAGEIQAAWNVKPGRFAEDVVSETLGEGIERGGRSCRMDQGDGRYYLSDGWVPSLGIHVESKFQAFWSTGSASEKLPMFLIKAAGYDHPVLLVLGGDLELLRDRTSAMVWKAYHLPHECQTASERVMLALVRAVGPRLAGIVALSELPDWLRSAERAPR
jgi:hypothetical protein